MAFRGAPRGGGVPGPYPRPGNMDWRTGMPPLMPGPFGGPPMPPGHPPPFFGGPGVPPPRMPGIGPPGMPMPFPPGPPPMLPGPPGVGPFPPHGTLTPRPMVPQSGVCVTPPQQILPSPHVSPAEQQQQASSVPPPPGVSTQPPVSAPHTQKSVVPQKSAQKPKPEPTELDEGEIVEDEDCSDHAHSQRGRANAKRYSNECQDTSQASHPRAPPPPRESRVRDDSASRRRDDSWSDRDSHRSYQNNRSRFDERHHSPNRNWHREPGRDAGRCDSRDDSRGRADNSRWERRDFDDRDRRRDDRRSDRQDFGLAAEQTLRRGELRHEGSREDYRHGHADRDRRPAHPSQENWRQPDRDGDRRLGVPPRDSHREDRDRNTRLTQDSRDVYRPGDRDRRSFHSPEYEHRHDGRNADRRPVSQNERDTDRGRDRNPVRDDQYDSGRWSSGRDNSQQRSSGARRDERRYVEQKSQGDFGMAAAAAAGRSARDMQGGEHSEHRDRADFGMAARATTSRQDDWPREEREREWRHKTWEPEPRRSREPEIKRESFYNDFYHTTKDNQAPRDMDYRQERRTGSGEKPDGQRDDNSTQRDKDDRTAHPDQTVVKTESVSAETFEKSPEDVKPLAAQHSTGSQDQPAVPGEAPQVCPVVVKQENAPDSSDMETRQVAPITEENQQRPPSPGGASHNETRRRSGSPRTSRSYPSRQSRISQGSSPPTSGSSRWVRGDSWDSRGHRDGRAVRPSGVHRPDSRSPRRPPPGGRRSPPRGSRVPRALNSPRAPRSSVRGDQDRASRSRSSRSPGRGSGPLTSSERDHRTKKAVAVVTPLKRSPAAAVEGSGSSKRARLERSRSTDPRERDADSRPREEVPALENISSSQQGWSVVDAVEDEEEDEAELSSPVPAWTRSSPADLYFSRDRASGDMFSSKRMWELEDKFEEDLLKRSQRVRDSKPKYEKPPRPAPAHHHHHHHHGGCHGEESDEDSSESSSDEDSDEENERVSQWMVELNAKKQHPERLHEELWFNEEGEMNDGPLCRCSIKSRRTGIRHDIYPGEEKVPLCDPHSNNSGRLFHYRIAMSPFVNFLSKRPTIIKSDNHEFIFEGFSLLSHYKIENVPVCKVIRFNIEYTIHWFEEDAPENIDVRSLDLFSDFVFDEILDLKDFRSKLPIDGSCRHFHLMPRFSRKLKENGKEMLSMNEVLLYLLKSAKHIVEEADLLRLAEMDIPKWEDWVESIRAMIISKPGMRPSAIRIDQLDREKLKADQDKKTFPTVVHFGIRPAQLSYAGDPNYQKLWKQYVKLKHLLANKPKVNDTDKRKLMALEDQLQDLRMKSSMKREVTVELSVENFVKTGIKSDICQHAMLLPVFIGHLRFHRCLNSLEQRIGYKFKDKMLIQLALTHPSYRVNFGTNPDHARNSLSNCGFRQPEYGDRRIHHVNNRKRGINTLINIMSRMGKKQETASEINHYERLEFLGDAVVEFLSSIHLFYMFPNLEEGGLATYRAAIVQNQHLSVLAKKLRLQEYMLYAHGPDLCHESDLKHAMANCFEALMGALFLDGGIDLADRVFGEVLWEEDERLLSTWVNTSRHPLQEDEPGGDRHWVTSSPVLQKLLKFEEETGIPFNHIRLLARAFTMRNVGYNNLTFGHNQRLEFLGDTVLQIVASEYLFKYFPEHHEGHLSLLRSSLVNNFTQAVVCDDLGMTNYIIHSDARLVDKDSMKHKEKADLLEAYIGALYVDRDLEYCQVFASVCFFPRLKQFIMNQDWNDPKSQLQQCCLTLRELEGGEPDIPIYKMIASTGPTNTRKYTVAVYFRRKRLATGTGHSIQMAEMAAATNALRDKSVQDMCPQIRHMLKFCRQRTSADLLGQDDSMEKLNYHLFMKNVYNTGLGMFPQLDHQKKFVEKKYKRRRNLQDGIDGQDAAAHADRAAGPRLVKRPGEFRRTAMNAGWGARGGGAAGTGRGGAAGRGAFARGRHMGFARPKTMGFGTPAFRRPPHSAATDKDPQARPGMPFRRVPSPRSKDGMYPGVSTRGHRAPLSRGVGRPTRGGATAPPRGSWPPGPR